MSAIILHCVPDPQRRGKLRMRFLAFIDEAGTVHYDVYDNTYNIQCDHDIRVSGAVYSVAADAMSLNPNARIKRFYRIAEGESVDRLSEAEIDARGLDRTRFEVAPAAAAAAAATLPTSQPKRRKVLLDLDTSASGSAWSSIFFKKGPQKTESLFFSHNKRRIRHRRMSNNMEKRMKKLEKENRDQARELARFRQEARDARDRDREERDRAQRELDRARDEAREERARRDRAEERAHELEMARRLKSDLGKLSDKKTFDVPECVVCLTNPSCVVLVPCLHRVMCVECYDGLCGHGRSRGSVTCPLCRKSVGGSIHAGILT
jgi:Skp family chaperone for outer membrane proteins